MEHIIDHLRESIQDASLTKSERRTLKSLLAETPLDQHQLNVLRNKVFELANEAVTPENYKYIFEWVKNAQSAFTVQEVTPSGAFFSPGDACRNSIIRHIDKAAEELKICVFTISDDWIAESIIRAHHRGLNVQIITDDDKSEDEGSDIEELARAGIPVKIDNSPNHMHHKFMVADQRVLMTGSYNWTRSAARYNHENILVTKEVGLVRSYLKEFSVLWQAMKRYS